MLKKEALGQIGEENPQDRDNQYEEEDAFKEKEGCGITTVENAEDTLLPCFSVIVSCHTLFLEQS